MDTKKSSNPSRSDSNAYIVMIGMTGAGKSSTLNSLFDREEANKVDLNESCKDEEEESGFTLVGSLQGSSSWESELPFTSVTQDVIEYHVTVTSDINVSQKMVVIDTPGFHDTNNEDYRLMDSRIIATLEKHLKEHEKLKNRYPTAVLLVFDLQDQSLQNESSYFIDFLTALDKLIQNRCLIDTNAQTCNLVVVLTHFKSASKEYQERPERRTCLIRGLIGRFTSIPPNFPIVYAENKPKSFKLPQEGDYYRLPTGDLYPFNLFTAIQSVATKSHDILAGKIIASAFRDPRLLKKETACVKPLVSENDKLCLKYFYAAKHKSCETDITKKLEVLWNELPSEETNGYGIFLELAKATFASNGINYETDISRLKETSNLLCQLPIMPPLEKIVRNLGIQPPLLWECARGVGSFYNITSDSPTTVCPFFSESYKITQIGFEGPPYLQVDSCNIDEKIFTRIENCPTRESYASKRLEHLRIQFDKNTSFRGEPRPAYNIMSTTPGKDVLVGIKEFRVYSICLSKDWKFHDCFVKAVTELSKTYLPNHRANFFAAYGTHILQQAYIGGYILVKATIENNNVHGRASRDMVIRYINNILDGVGKKNKCADFRLMQGWSFRIEYFGGDAQLEKPTINNVYEDRGIEQFDKWIASLKVYPTLLTSSVELEHVSSFYKSVDVALANMLSIMANKTLGCSLYVDPDKPAKRAEVGWSCVVM